MTEAYPMATLYRALHAARKATKALIRDDIAPATDRRGPFTYPSQESVQEAWYTAEAEFGGTTLRVAVKHGRRALGFEINARFAEASCKPLSLGLGT